MKKDLLANSIIVKKEADDILKKTNIIKTLSKFGDVFIMGSYKLDLMLDGDIDIYVINKNLNKETSLKALFKIISNNNFTGHLYYDYVSNPQEWAPNGYYIGLKTKYNDRRWKFDIWMLNSMDKKSNDLMEYVENNLNKVNKKIILKLKYLAKNNGIKNFREIPSHEIYLAVLKNGAKSVKDLKNSINK